MDVSVYFRKLIVGAETGVPLISGEHVPAINFDNAATTPPFVSVMTEIARFAPWYSSIHRGKGYKSVFSSNVYEEGRNVLAQFVNADKNRDHVVYTKNTTESINILSYLLHQRDRDQVILTTDMEHLANDLPWRDRFKVSYAAVDGNGKLSLVDLENKLIGYEGQIKLVAVTGASNVTGYINPIHDIARLAHKYGAAILVDAAQLIPHAPINMKPHGSPEHIDYLVFSGHKMYAPFGIGVLIGPKELFENTEPVYKGGGAVRLVSREFVQWDEPPAKDEAGTPNLMGLVALITAIRTIQAIGIHAIRAYENSLSDYLLSGMKRFPDIKIYAQYANNEERVSLLPFNMEGVHHNILAEIVSREAGIAVRSGLFCAHPYAQKLLQLSPEELEHYRDNKNVPLPGMVRVSFAMYNNRQEIDVLIDILNRISKNKSYLVNKYKNAILCARP